MFADADEQDGRERGDAGGGPAGRTAQKVTTSASPQEAGVESHGTLDRLERMEGLLRSLVEREQVKDFYSTEEFGKLVDKAEFTVREWCRLGRIKAIKKSSGRGKHQGWAISHDELLRFRKEGLLPQPR